MAQTSPSSQRVDDFLSTLSDLSQERLKQDQQRQRDLQRNIDELRGRLASASPVKPTRTPPVVSKLTKPFIPLLKFNRVASDTPPPMPARRDEAPPLPRRRDEGPPLPRRRDEPPRRDEEEAPPLPKRGDMDFSIDLINPVAKTENYSILNEKSLKEPLNGLAQDSVKLSTSAGFGTPRSSSDRYRSFTQMEETIKTGKPWTPNEKPDSLSKSFEKTSDKKPQFSLEKPQFSTLKESSTNSSSVEKPTDSSSLSSWKPPASSFNATTSGPKPLFPQRVYYSSSSIQKGDRLPERGQPKKQPPPKPGKPPATKPSGDWMSSLSSNKISTSTPQDSTATSSPALKKSDWLSSTMSNRISTSTHQDSTGAPNFSASRQKADWMSSLSNSKPELRQSSPQASQNRSPSPASPSKKPTSWIDSALKKSDSHKYIEPPSKPTFQIKKKTKEIPEREEKVKFELEKIKLRKPEAPPKPLKPKPDNKDEEILRATMSKLHSGKQAPEKPAKLDKYTKEEEQLLKSTMSKLGSGKTPPPKPSKPSVNQYTHQEEELLKLTMSRLSPKKPEPKPKSYEERDTELLKSQMKKLGPKSAAYHQIAAQEEDIEGLAVLKRLKRTNPEKKKEDNTKKKTSEVSKNKPEKLEKKNSEASKIKPEKPEKPKPVLEFKNNPVDLEDLVSLKPELAGGIHDKLSSILRASTVPELAKNGPKPLARTSTDPLPKRKDTSEPSKLTHMTKGRSKGPKRKLPKSMKTDQSETTKEKITNSNTESTDTTSNETTSKESIGTEPTKKPPLVNKLAKPKPVPPLKPSRKVSGELFI